MPVFNHTDKYLHYLSETSFKVKKVSGLQIIGI